MGLLDGMKDRLGFGGKPEWADDAGEYYDDAAYDDRYDDYADDGVDDGYDTGRHEVISFDSYNPENFEHVTISSRRQPRVATYDDKGSSRSSRGYSSRGASSSYGRSTGVSSSRRDYPRASGEPTWAAPEDPSFLNSTSSPRASRERVSSLSTGSVRASGDPNARLEIVEPKAYADIEKVANACKVGKVVILNVVDTKPALAKRILDFSFGVASALNLNVGKAADRVFVISKNANPLSDEDREYLKTQDVLK